MSQVGIVRQVQERGTYCFIDQIPGESHPRFAHIRDFFQPEMMREGQRVKFTPNNVPQPGRKYLGAINVEAA